MEVEWSHCFKEKQETQFYDPTSHTQIVCAQEPTPAESMGASPAGEPGSEDPTPVVAAPSGVWRTAEAAAPAETPVAEASTSEAAESVPPAVEEEEEEAAAPAVIAETEAAPAVEETSAPTEVAAAPIAGES